MGVGPDKSAGDGDRRGQRAVHYRTQGPRPSARQKCRRIIPCSSRDV
jgi:hypothetical protein